MGEYLLIGSVIGLYIFLNGIKFKNIYYIIIGLSFFIADLLMYFFGKNIKKSLNDKKFKFLFMFIPAYIYSPILFIQSFKDKSIIIRIFSIIVFIIDNIHLFE